MSQLQAAGPIHLAHLYLTPSQEEGMCVCFFLLLTFLILLVCVVYTSHYTTGLSTHAHHQTVQDKLNWNLTEESLFTSTRFHSNRNLFFSSPLLKRMITS